MTFLELNQNEKVDSQCNTMKYAIIELDGMWYVRFLKKKHVYEKFWKMVYMRVLWRCGKTLMFLYLDRTQMVVYKLALK